MHSVSPEQSASLFSRLCFRWVKPTLKEGLRTPLNVDSLLPLNAAENPERCDDAFAQTLEGNASSSRPVLRSVLQLHKRAFVFAFALSMLHLMASVSSPLVLRKLIQTISAGVGALGGVPYLTQGLGLAAMLFVTTLVTSMTAHHIFHILLKLMIRIKVALVSAIYRKSLSLTVESRQKMPAGQIINLMGTDAQKFVNAINVIHSVWMHPLQFVLVLGVLYWILGPAALAGAAMLGIFLYLSAILARKQIKTRRELVRYSDDRVGLMNEILMSVRIIKFYAWEASFAHEVSSIRDQEVVRLSRLARLGAVSTLIFLSAPVVVAVVTFATYVLSGHGLNAADVFSSLALFAVLRQAMVMLPDVVASCLEANVAVGRIETFLKANELPSQQSSTLPVGSISVQNLTAEWTPGHPAISELSLEVMPGQMVCVVGSVGSGKSALMSTLLGDLVIVEGQLDVSGEIAFVSQQAWILNDSIRNNILFGAPYDAVRYVQALQASSLIEDLEAFLDGDETEIGERGVNLSGGQRQRISLARAVYSAAPIVLLDDPLSALDNKVGQSVYDECICGVLSNRTRIFATHRLEYVEDADLIVLMQGGKAVECGEPHDMKNSSHYFSDLWRAYEEGLGPKSEGHDGLEGLNGVDSPTAHAVADTNPHKKATRLITDEERNTGVVGLGVYLTYLSVFAPGMVVAVLLLICLMKEVFNVGTDSWLAFWSAAKDFEMWTFLTGFLLLGLLACASTFVRSLMISLRGLDAGTEFHTRLLQSIVRAPMGFFEGTPVGRVLNRFSRDMEAVDQQIPRSLHEAIGCIFTILSTLAVIVWVTPIALLAVVPIAGLYYFVQRYYRPASREGQRLDSVTRSPIFAQFSESLAGVQVIRAFRAEKRFEAELLKHLGTNSRTFYTIVSANRWLGTRIEALGAGIVGTAAFSAVLAGQTAGAGFAGLSVTYALAITGAMNWAVRMFSQLESNLNSVERIDHYSKLASERWAGLAVASSWPSKGEVVFDKLELRYRPELKPVIHNLSVVVQPGEKIGVVGRTGAGKSSLLLALYRIVEASSGRILIDGVDIAQLDLRELRAALAIIPQEPMLFRGSIRKNLDPFAQYSDQDLWDVLTRAELKTAVERMPRRLDENVFEGGSNFSVGQRQLLCLARALLKRSRILLMDEATASVDVATDALIQRAIRAEFREATVITIAHRLNTVMDCDRVLVLERGQVVEFDTPQALLRRKVGAFAAL